MGLVSVGKCWVDTDKDYNDAGGYQMEDLREVGEVYLIDLELCKGDRALSHLNLPTKGEVFIYISQEGKFELVPKSLIKEGDVDHPYNSAEENTCLAVKAWLKAEGFLD